MKSEIEIGEIEIGDYIPTLFEQGVGSSMPHRFSHNTCPMASI